MAITRQDETDILGALYEGVLESPLWSTFLRRLRQRSRADFAGLTVGRPDGVPEVFQFGAEHQDVQRHFVEELRGADPLVRQSLRPNRVYTFDEVFDRSLPEHQRLAETLIAPAVIQSARMVRVEAGGHYGWLMIALGKGDFDASEGALLSALAPHIAIAVRIYAAMQRERLRADISSDVVQRLNFGWITLDGTGHIVDYDDQADRLLRTSPALRKTASGRLLPSSREAEGALAQLLRQVAGGQEVRSRAIHLSDEPWLDMLVTPIRGTPFARSKAPVLVAYVHGEERSSADRQDQLMALFGLTRKEALLAIALSHGRSIAQASEDLGLTLETTRLYSKRLYAKTGTTGQADLVRLVLASVLALA